LRTRAIKEEEKLSFHTITSYSWEDDGKFVKYAHYAALARQAPALSTRAPLGVLSSRGTLGVLYGYSRGTLGVPTGQAPAIAMPTSFGAEADKVTSSIRHSDALSRVSWKHPSRRVL
jgi:hypothetical protein